MKNSVQGKKNATKVLSSILSLSMLASVFTPLTTYAMEGNALDIGRPVFKNTEKLAEVYNHPVEFTAGNVLSDIYEKDLADGGESFYMDRILARPGVANGDPNSNGNRDGNTIMSRGRALYMYTSSPNIVGFGGNAAYHQPIGTSYLYRVQFANASGSAISATEVTDERMNMPSHWSSQYRLGSTLKANVSKFINYQNVAVTMVELENTGSADQEIVLNVDSTLARQKSSVIVGGKEQDELVGSVTSPNNLTQITTRLTGSDLAANDNATALTGKIVVPANSKKEVKVVMVFETKEIPESTVDYVRFAEYGNKQALDAQKQEYNQWWDENIPYIDVPNKAIQKAIDYRWWLERFNSLDANIPGYDYQYPVTIEGVLGYNNAIVLTQPMHLQDTKWMRSAYLPYGQLLSVGNSSQSSAFLDNPGNRGNWNNHYGQYLGTAGLEAFSVIGGNEDIARTLAYYFEYDAKGQLDHYGNHTSATTPQNYLMDYRNNYMTGNDADTISMHYPGIGTWKTHAENAYVYGAANAAQKLYSLTGDTAKAQELGTLAENIQKDILNYLWCNKCNAFETRAVSPSGAFVVHNPDQPNLVPYKESNNFNYFSEGVIPTDEASIEKYGKALDYLRYADEFPLFPYYTANQVDNQKLPGSNNFSNINFTVQARAYEAALRTYDPDSKYVTPEMLATMVEWCAWNMYPTGGDITYPNNNEFFNFNGKNYENYYRSWIYHNILGNYNYIFVEDMAGVRPRTDEIIELSPIDFGYDHFMVNNIRYHGKDLTIVWDAIDGKQNYDQIPEGYSLYVDGELVLRLNKLVHVEYDVNKGTVDFAGKETADILFSKSSQMVSAIEVGIAEEKVVNMFKKSGIDVTVENENLLAGKAVTASFTPTKARAAAWAEKHRADGTDNTSKAVNEMLPAASAVTDGMTVNMPFWGNYQSKNATDWLEFDLGSQQTFDMLNLFFYNDRQNEGYAEPGSYILEYWDGVAWKNPANQTKTPLQPWANYNNNKFTAVTSDKIRVSFKNLPNKYTAVTEIQLFNEGGEREPVVNQAPVVTLKVNETKKENLKAYLIATCLDDGMPYDSNLTFRWDVVSKPDGATTFFSDASILTPSLSATMPGDYVVRFTATDGEYTSEKILTVTISESEIVADTDLAPLATAGSDYTAGWENVSKVNDPFNVPANSNPGSGKGWGNWGCPGGTGSTHYLEYTWTEPVSIYKNDIYWYDDGGGTRIPSSVKFQYKDEKGAWKDAVMLTDYSTVKVKNQYNTIEFEPITTTQLRMNCVLAAPGTGVLRWKVYSTTVEEIQPVFVATKAGEIPKMPTEAYAKMVGAGMSYVPVLWDEITPEQVATDSTLNVTGIHVASGKVITATVYVRSDMDQATITDVHPTEAYTVLGRKPTLPRTAKVGYNNGAIDNVNVPVVWDAVPDSALNELGKHVLTGLGTVEGSSTKANLTLNTITASVLPPDKSELKSTIDAVKKLVQDEYTVDSWTKLQTALLTAEGVYGNPKATEKAVKDALDGLKDAQSKLEKKPDAIKNVLHLGLNKGADVTEIKDSSANGFNGMISGLTGDNWVKGINGDALKFTGENSWYDIPAGQSLNNPSITLSYWIKRTGTLSGNNSILWAKNDSAWNGEGFYTNYPVGEKYSSFFVIDGFNGFYVAEDPNTFLPENEWTHIAVTWSTATKVGKIYKNGVEQLTTKVGNPEKLSAPSAPANRLGMNGYPNDPQYPVGLQLDDFRIYSADMGAGSIKEIYDEFAGGEPEPTTDMVRMGTIEPISGKAGTEFSIPVQLDKFPSGDYRAIDGVISVPDGVSAQSITISGNLTGGRIESNLLDGKLRFSYLNLPETTVDAKGIAFKADSYPADLLTLTFKLDQEFAQNSSLAFRFESMRALTDDSTLKAEFDVSEGDTAVSVSDPVVVTAMARELYTGDSVDVIPSGKKAVAVEFVNLEGTPNVVYNGIQMHYSSELSKNNPTYVVMVDTAIELSDIEKNYLTDTSAVSKLMFGDINNDKAVNADDALRILQFWLRKGEEPTDKQMMISNVSADGRIDTSDVISVVDYYISTKPFVILSK